MKRKLIIAMAIVLALLALGGTLWIVKGKDKKNTSSSSQDNSQSNQESSQKSSKQSPKQSSSSQTTFNPQPLTDIEFAASLTSAASNGSSISANMEYDKDTNAWRYAGQSGGSAIEAIYTTDAYYIKMGESWMKLPPEQGTQTFNPGQYKYDQSSIKDFQSKVQNKGQQSCPAGTCQVWEVSNYQGNDKITFYTDISSNRISQVITESSAGKNTIIYTYKDITVTAPANAITTNLQHPNIP